MRHIFKRYIFFLKGGHKIACHGVHFKFIPCAHKEECVMWHIQWIRYNVTPQGKPYKCTQKRMCRVTHSMSHIECHTTKKIIQVWYTQCHKSKTIMWLLYIMISMSCHATNKLFKCDKTIKQRLMMNKTRDLVGMHKTYKILHQNWIEGQHNT
jgi:hypothetical protein